MLWLFACVLLFFHASEVTLVVAFNRPELEWSCTPLFITHCIAPIRNMAATMLHRHEIGSHTPFAKSCCAMIAALLITKPYSIALSVGVMEHIVRGWLLNTKPYWWPVSLLGMAMIVIGEVVRKTAMVRYFSGVLPLQGQLAV